MSNSEVGVLLLFALGGSAFTIDGIVSLIPTPATRDYFEVHAIRGERHDDTAMLWVDRTIKAPVHMGYIVRVHEWTAAGWRQYCRAAGPTILYKPDTILDQPVSLDWWSDGICPTLPDGPARIVTTWQPTFKDAAPLTYTVSLPARYSEGKTDAPD